EQPAVQEEVDDMTKFIRSGKKIHPAAMDRITNERMGRKIQADMYSKQQAQEAGKNAPAKKTTTPKVDTTKKSDASTPTNEEIVAALDTLSKVGLNPITQLGAFNNPFSAPIAAISQYGFNSNFAQNPMYLNTLLSNSSSDTAKMIMYSQMSQQQNNMLNYGI
ncbi:hypothetical protein IJ531_00595, partial [bacterium]|nr:hypothetical protein [bacterium]